jgi:hypothetical protein
MSRNRRGPALIELMRERSQAWKAEPKVAAPEPAPPTDSAPAPLWAPARQGAKTPIGYIFLAAAGALAFVIAGYFLGYQRGVSAEKLRFAATQSPIPGPVIDPLAKPMSNQPADTGAPRHATQAPAKPPPPSAGAAGDPRVAGLNYFILADRIDEAEAAKAADFLSANGVAAAVVASNNAKYRRVIATRGFSAAEVDGPEAARLKTEAARLGSVYRSRERGLVDFAKVYAEKFNP